MDVLRACLDELKGLVGCEPAFPYEGLTQHKPPFAVSIEDGTECAGSTIRREVQREVGRLDVRGGTRRGERSGTRAKDAREDSVAVAPLAFLVFGTGWEGLDGSGRGRDYLKFAVKETRLRRLPVARGPGLVLLLGAEDL